MKLLTKIGLGASVVALGLVGTMKGCEVRGAVEKKVKEVEMKIIPKSVSKGDYGTGMSALAICGMKDKKVIVAYDNLSTCKASIIEALIESEIGDGDNEEIILKGSYKPGDNFGQVMFDPDYIEVSGYKFRIPF